MAYEGYLIKIGDYELPNTYIVMKSYKASRKVQDLNPYRDGNGVLHREALSHVPIVCEFQLRQLSNTEFDRIMLNILRNFTVAQERKATVKCWVPETGAYSIGDMYIPDPDITILREEAQNNLLVYDAVSMSFIGY